MKEYKVISQKHPEWLVDELNAHSSDGWDIAAYFQEFGVTKFVLEREKK